MGRERDRGPIAVGFHSAMQFDSTAHPLVGSWELVDTTDAWPYFVEALSPSVPGCLACCLRGTFAKAMRRDYGTVQTIAVDEAARSATVTITPGPRVKDAHKPYYGTHVLDCSGARFHTHATIHDPGLSATAEMTERMLAYTLDHTKQSRIEYRASGYEYRPRDAKMTITVTCNKASFVCTYRRTGAPPGVAATCVPAGSTRESNFS